MIMASFTKTKTIIQRWFYVFHAINKWSIFVWLLPNLGAPPVCRYLKEWIWCSYYKSSANINVLLQVLSAKVSLYISKILLTILGTTIWHYSWIEKLGEQVAKLVENTQHSRSVQPDNSKAINDPQTSSSQDRKAPVNSDRNFNIVFGIEESPPQTSRFDHQKHDLGRVKIHCSQQRPLENFWKVQA